MAATSSLTLAESTSSSTASAAPATPLSSSQTDADVERPTLLVLNNTTATALATTTTTTSVAIAAAAATSPSGGSLSSISGGGGGSCGSNNSSTATSPSFLPEMPQWKKDLIQRRKTNVARTIGAASAVITPTSPSSSSSIATSLSPSLQQRRGSITLSDQQQQQLDITDGLESPAKKDFTLQSTTVYQTQQQQQQQLTTTKVSTTSKKNATATTIGGDKLQIINAKSNLAATTKMPATLNSPTKRNSPLSTIITKDKAEKFLGGHYTPQAAAASAAAAAATTKDQEYERIDRRDIIEQQQKQFQQQQQQMATKSSSPLSSPTKSSLTKSSPSSPSYTNTIISPPIPKQRSLFLASKYQNTNTKEQHGTAVDVSAACTLSTVSSHASFASCASTSSSVTSFTSSPPPGNNNNNSNNERNNEKRGTAINTITTTVATASTSAIATITRLTSSSVLRERIVVGAAAAAAAAADYNDDGEGSAATTTADEVIEMQETETTRKSKTTTKSKSGTYASIPEQQQQQQQQLRNVMQSTTTISEIKTNTTTTPTGANTTITTSPLLSPTVASMLSIQSHSKYESERTSSKLTNNFCTKANANANATTTIPLTTPTDNCEKPFLLLSNYSSALTVSGSGGSGSGSVGTNNKISNKLQNNQFIKNQQNTATTSSTTAAKYYKYKTYSLQESQALTNIPSTASAPTGSGSGSPNKSQIIATTTNTATTATTSAGSSKNKMVAVQEMMKTTQNAASHHHHHHAHHAHHQQHHHNQHHQIIGGVSATTTCARQQQQQQQTNGNGNSKHQRSAESEKDFVDTSEDLSYGPGIVSKLRCRYLSLALRESMEKQRHCLDNLRRATSLNNLLDRDDHHKDHDADDQDEDDYEEEEVELRGGGDKKRGDGADGKHRTGVVGISGILKYNNDVVAATQESLVGGKKTATFQKYAGVSSTTNGRMSQSQHGGPNNDGTTSAANDSTSMRSRHVKRGNDSLKRARSVEALLCEKSPWTSYALNRTSFDQNSRSGSAGAATVPPTCVTIEDKIHNARGRLISGTDAMPPKRLTSIIDDTERPPPDLVKQTLKLFEATANRRPRANRANGKGEVASKVANYKTIIKENKPAIVFPKPPSSPTKKSPAHVKSAAKPVVAAADLIGSPIGRKTSATISSANTPYTMEQNLLTSSTPKHASNASTPLRSMQTTASNAAAVAAVSGGSGCLSQHTPDIIPRHKLLTERASESAAVIDSPVTALTKKLEKLSIESDKHQTIKQSGSNNSNKSNNVTTKESQAKQQHQQQHPAHKLTAEPLNDSNEVNNELQHDNDYSNKFVGGGTSSEGGCSASGGDGGGGGDAVENDKKSDRAASGTTTATIEQQPNTVQAGTAAISSDLSDDEYGLTTQQTQTATKRVTKTALDNIAKAGTTQQFKFAGGNGKPTTTATTPTKTNTNGSPSSSSDLPVTPVVFLPPYTLSSSSDKTSSVLNAAPGKQIGVIRPLLAINNTQTITTNYSNTTTNTSSTHTTTSSSTNNQQLQHMEALKQQTTYSPHHSLPTYTSTSTNTTSPYTPPTPPQLTSREIEKNRINEMKKIALTDHAAAAMAANASVSANANNATASATTSSLYTVINTNSSSSSGKSHTVATSATTSSSMSMSSSTTSGFSELDSVIAANNSPLWALRKKRQAPAAVAENTTMVFNFSNRKEVPDYIENDGVIFRRKRELPKPNESGFVLLGDLSLETSTDTDYDDFSMCPPSPCDVEFENANIVIDGKSSIRQKSKEATFRVQFNDTLTSTFEYPSEASLVIEESFSVHYGNNDDLVSAYENLVLEDNTDSPVHHHHHHVAVDEIIQLPTTQSNASPANANNSSTATTNTPTKNMLGNLPLDYPSLAKGIMLQQQAQPLEEQPQPQQQNQQALKETQQQQEQEQQKQLLQEQLEPQEKLPMQYEKKEDEQQEQKQQQQQQLPPIRPTDLPLIPIAMPMAPATKTQLKDKPKVPMKRIKINQKSNNKFNLNELQKDNEDDILSKQKIEVETIKPELVATAASSSNHQTSMMQPETTTSTTKPKIIKKPPIEMIIPEYKPPSVVGDFKLASFKPKPVIIATETSTTITCDITTGSNTTENHTTPTTTTITTTITTPSPQPPPIMKRYQRKTPTVLSKPQYAHFLQNDLLLQKQGAEEKNSRNNLVLRTRSNEFLLNDSKTNSSNKMNNKNYMKFSSNNLSPNLQQRSSSFSFGSAPLSFYTPVKAPIDNLFQLGVTRAPNGSSSSHTTNGNGTTTNTHNGSNGSVVGINDGLNGSKSNGRAADNGGGGDENDEPESLQYIKPANDDLTIAYSEGAQKTDLLY